MYISARAFQRLFTRKIWLRYGRERALQSLPALRVQIPQVLQTCFREDCSQLIPHKWSRRKFSMDNKNGLLEFPHPGFHADCVILNTQSSTSFQRSEMHGKKSSQVRERVICDLPREGKFETRSRDKVANVSYVTKRRLRNKTTSNQNALAKSAISRLAALQALLHAKSLWKEPSVRRGRRVGENEIP